MGVGGGTKSQYIMMAAAAVVSAMSFLSLYKLYYNFAVFMEMEM